MIYKFRPIRRRDTYASRRRVRVIQRRIDRLEARLDNYEGDPNRTREELAALKWMLGICKRWIGEDPLFDYDWSGTPFTDNAQLNNIIDLLGCPAQYKGEAHEIVGARFVESSNGHRVVRLTLRKIHEDDRRPLKISERPVRLD